MAYSISTQNVKQKQTIVYRSNAFKYETVGYAFRAPLITVASDRTVVIPKATLAGTEPGRTQNETVDRNTIIAAGMYTVNMYEVTRRLNSTYISSAVNFPETSRKVENGMMSYQYYA